MFELKEHQAQITNVNHRAENHGDKKKLAFDLKIVVSCHNRVLNNFDALLPTLFFRIPGSGEQVRLVSEDESDKLTELRNLRLAPLKWDEKYPGYKLTFASGLGLSKPVVLDPVELSKFTFEAMDGGSVEITFCVQGMEPADSKTSLQKLLLDMAVLTLEPPAPGEWPKAGDQIGDLAAGGAAPLQGVLVTECTIKENRSTHLFEVRVILSDGTPLRLSDLAYRPDMSQVIDLMKMDHSLDATIAPAVQAEVWPAKAA